MQRTTVGVSFLVLFGVLSACSSKATDNNDGNGGNGTVLSGGSGGGANGGAGGGVTPSGGTISSGGTSSGGSGGTNASTTGGNAGRAGATSSAGMNGLCADDTITCIDDAQATGCNPNTGSVEIIDCVEYYATLGVTSTGCSVTADGAGCDVTDFKDAACLAGAEAYAFCANASDQDLVSVYIDCFQDYMGAHTVVTCLGDYVSPTMMMDADCQNAVDACLAGAGGAGSGPGDGAGGAP
jgi:hypothetical protein